MSDSESSEQPAMPQAPSAMYFNSFALGVGSIDISLIVQLNQVPQLELKMTYNTAKGLAEALSAAVGEFERLSGTKVLSGPELTKIVSDSAKHKKAN